MRRLFLFLGDLVLCQLFCMAQTNVVETPAPGLFSLPSLTLREEWNEIRQPPPEIGAIEDDLHVADEADESSLEASNGMDLIALRDEYELQMLNQVDLSSWLTLQEPESRFERFMQNSFEPGVIQIGRVGISCALITAIQRKNPLCLINPYFFNISW